MYSYTSAGLLALLRLLLDRQRPLVTAGFLLAEQRHLLRVSLPQPGPSLAVSMGGDANTL
jgi:hypothetical protein